MIKYLVPARIAARDACGIIAVASIAYGSWMVYPPAGFIVGGLIVLAGVLAMARGGS